MGDHRPISRPEWCRGGVAVAVLAGHAALLLALITMRIVEEKNSEAVHETELVLVPLAAKLPEKIRARSLRGADKAMPPDYQWIIPGAHNAITILISPYVVKASPPCPKTLNPETTEGNARCGSAAKTGEGIEFDTALTRELDLRHRGQWEAERRARNEPLVVPCSYTHTFPASGGPPPPPVKMVNIGCAAKHLFGR